MSENLTLRLRKIIKAPRTRAYEAWTRPEDLLLWFAPGAMRASAIDIDLNVGGSFRWMMEGPSPRTGEPMEIVFIGTFQAIVPNELLQFSWRSEGEPDDSTVVTVSFGDVEGGTEVLLTHEHIGTVERYNRNRMGWASMLDKLGALADQMVVLA